MDFDILVRGGIVVDGTGGQAVPNDVAISGGRIAAVDRLDGAGAEQIIEAAGLVVAPGFIDVHVHSEITRLGGRDQLSGIVQGVTTELMSPDGFSWAPLAPPRSREVADYLRVFYEDLPLSWKWRTVEEYISIFAGRLPGNLVPQAPHLAIKVAAMGWETRAAEVHEVEAMDRLVREWLDAGAVSLAAGLEYQPGAFSTTEELVELCRRAATTGAIYAPHQRGYWGRLRQGISETFRIGREAGIPVHISHLAINDEAAQLIEEAVASGVDVSFDMYPYPAACTHLLMMLPEWAQAGGYAAAMARIRDPDQRRLLHDETARRLAERGEVLLSFVEGGQEMEGRLLSELAGEAGMAEADYLLDLLAEHAGRALAIYHWPSTHNGEEILRRTLAHPLFMGSSDGIFKGSRPHRRGFGTFPRIVGDYVRDGTLRLEQAVHKVTGRPAERFRIQDRGFLRRGFAADVAIFDPYRIADRSTWEEPRRAPTGVAHVLVNGEIVLRDGRPTGSMTGEIVRSRR